MSFFFGSHRTPKSIKRVIVVLVASALLVPVITFFLKYLNKKGPLDFFPLTLAHIKAGYFFELFTYPLVQSSSVVINFSLLWSLTFQMFIFWFAGSELLLRLGKKFWLLLISGTLIPAGAFLLSQVILGETSSLFGTYPLLFSLLTVLALEAGSLQIHFLLFFHFALRNLIFLFLAISLLFNLSNGEFSSFFAKIAASGWGILFAKFSLKIPTFRKKKKCEIIEITEWEQSSEDAFVDQMLDKIAKHGRESLTEKEKKQLDEIIKKKE